MMSLIVSAAPQPPFILYGQVNWNDQLLSGSKLDITINSITEQTVADGNGVWVHQILSYSDGDIVTVKVLDGCGIGDTCSKSITIGAIGAIDYSIIDFSITGDLSCPPTSCPSCGGGGGSYYTESICNRKYPCADVESKECPIPEYTQANCNTLFPCDSNPSPDPVICPIPITCPEEKVCDTCDESEPKGFAGLLAGIALFILSMGGGIQIYRNRKGGITMLHRHRGILGYHNVNRGHRNPMYDHAALDENPLQYAKDLKRING